MRIIAGQRRGHKFASLPGPDLRPTSDMVRESIFNILRDVVMDRVVYDLFAGTGALGLEALSRGATRAIFVERDRETAGLVRRNLETLRYEHRGTVVIVDVYRWAKTFRRVDDQPCVVFIDPPYREFDKKPRQARHLLEQLEATLPIGSMLVVESGRDLSEDILPRPEEWDQRRYGSTHLAIRTLEPRIEPEGEEDDVPTDIADAPG